MNNCNCNCRVCVFHGVALVILEVVVVFLEVVLGVLGAINHIGFAARKEALILVHRVHTGEDL